MKIIITGASGFVGQNLSVYLKDKQYEVNALSLRNANWMENVDFEVDAVIHLAGKAHDTSNVSDARSYFAINRDLTIELFNKFLESNIRDFFFFSSVKAVADTVENVLTEDQLACPLTSYGKSKLEAEEYLLGQQVPDGKRLFIIRPCMVHGPGNKGNLNLLYSIVRKGIPWPLADFYNQRSFLSIDNLNFLIHEMMRSQKARSGIYNFADDETLSTNALVKLIGNCIGQPTRLWHLPSGLIKRVAKIGDILPFPLNSERLKKLTESYVVSNEKIKRELGLAELPLAAKAGLEKTIRSFGK